MLTQLKTAMSLQDLSVKLDATMFIMALLASAASSFVASALYVRFCQRKGMGSQIHRSFPLLGVSITTLFICVQVSLPLSLGLLGALSIIRFRTPVKEPEETGFLMLVIASAITCATFNFQFLVLLFLIAALALFVQMGGVPWRKAHDGMLVVALTDEQARTHQAGLVDCVRKQTRSVELESSTSKDGLTSLHFSFCGLRTTTTDLSVQLRGLAELMTVNIFFNRPG